MKKTISRLLPKEALPMSSVMDLLRIVRRNLIFIALVAALIMSAVIAGVYLRKPAFESDAKILVNFEGMGVSLSRAEYQLGTTQIMANEVITSQSEILRSRTLIENVIDGLGVEALRDPPPKSLIGRIVGGTVRLVGNAVEGTLYRLGLSTRMDERDALALRLSKALNVYPVRQSHIMLVSVRWHRPEIAKLLLDKVMEVYFSMSREIGQKASSYEVFAEQTRRLSGELSKAEQVMLDFKLKNKVQDLPREKQLLIGRIEKLAGLSQGLDPDGTALPSDIPVSNSDEVGSTIAQVASLRTQLTTLTVERSRLLVGSTELNPAVREIDGQIAATEKSLALALARAGKTLEETRARLAELNEIEATYERIRRDVELAGDAYQTYRKVTEDRRAMQSRNSHINLQVIDSPSLPLSPVGPARIVLLLAGLFFSLILAVALTLLLHYVRNWVRKENSKLPA